MNENEFNSLADMALTRIETACDNAGVDVNRSGNVLEIEFETAQKSSSTATTSTRKSGSPPLPAASITPT